MLETAQESGFHMERQEKDTVQISKTILFCKFYFFRIFMVEQIAIQSLIIYRACSKPCTHISIKYELRSLSICPFWPAVKKKLVLASLNGKVQGCERTFSPPQFSKFPRFDP